MLLEARIIEKRTKEGMEAIEGKKVRNLEGVIKKPGATMVQLGTILKATTTRTTIKAPTMPTIKATMMPTIKETTEPMGKSQSVPLKVH